MFWKCKNCTSLLYHRAKFGKAWISHAAKKRKCSVCFCCFSFVRHACEWQSLWTPLRHQCGNHLSTSERAMFVVVHSRSTLSLQRWAEPPQDDEFKKNGKIGGSRFKGYAMNWTDRDEIWNLAHERGPWVNSIVPNSTRIGPWVWVQEPQKIFQHQSLLAWLCGYI